MKGINSTNSKEGGERERGGGGRGRRERRNQRGGLHVKTCRVSGSEGGRGGSPS